METRLTLKEISEQTGVSITTVSRVLSNAENVSQSTRDKVMTAISTPKDSQKKLIALVVPDSANNFFVQLLQGIESISRLQNYSLIVCHTENSPIYEERSLEKLLEINIDGILFIGTGKTSEQVKTIISEKHTPIVFLDRDPKVKNSYLVTADSMDGMYQAAKYLLSLGHRNLLYLDGSPNISTSNLRRQGFEKALSQWEIPSENVMVACADFSLDRAFQIVEQMIIESNFHATAVCAANDMMAFGAYKALKEHKYRVPEDVSLIGYDDIPTTAILDLTTIHQPYVEMGRTAMMLLHSLITDTEVPSQINMLGTSLIVRNSCARAKEGWTR